MTTNQFAELCAKHLIDPGVALENDKIIAALKAKATAEEIEEILTEEF